MSKLVPPDQAQRMQALDPIRSILVQAPAGSGKTDLLTRRFLRLLLEVNEPSRIVAITFTKAAAAEMRHRIISELEKAAARDALPANTDGTSMGVLAHCALNRSRELNWQLLDLPSQLRITTIDSFCRDLAIQQPLISGFGSDLAIHEQPAELYHRAARRTLQQLSENNGELTSAIEDLLIWRDNNWPDLENQLVEMLSKRDRWMHEFVLQRVPDWDGLRARLEQPFCQVVAEALGRVVRLFATVPHACDEAMLLARFACEHTGGKKYRDLAELSEIPVGPFECGAALEEARVTFHCLADMLLTREGVLRQKVDKADGFPPDRLGEKLRMQGLINNLSNVDSLESALAAIRGLPPARYTEDDWKIVRACFILLRHAAGELHTVFAEVGAVDFIEVAQIAQRALTDENGLPSDAAIAIADGIHHLLVDECQDTSRRQQRMLGSLAAAWPDQTGRTVFVVGDPMQSIYFFRDADAELFTRLREFGLDIPGSAPLSLDPVRLTANFRTAPALVDQQNSIFAKVFAQDDGSGIDFTAADPAREASPGPNPRLQMHLAFMPQSRHIYSSTPEEAAQKHEAMEQRTDAHNAQTTELLQLIRIHCDRVEAARRSGQQYRIAVLARARASLTPIASALRKAGIPFRAIELEQLKDRPEVIDVLTLARALFNPVDRVAWLGVLRAPWCGLSLADLHILTSADEKALLKRPVLDQIAERIHLVSHESQAALKRVLDVIASAPRLRIARPTVALGTWLQQVWLSLGGASCLETTARANVELLWSCLDSLSGGEQDLLGPALETALEKLTALPDPLASSECGVQLMTIHKSKGLEFEVVIVPELQASTASTRGKMLSWLERGLAEPDETGEVTEFLVAPLQSKGTDRGKAKAWVDRIYRQRELQEMRRILYVAATRAREELHFFARPEYKDDNGNLALVDPSNCLLATAWPAFGAEIHARFAEWKSAQTKQTKPAQGTLIALAASGNDNMIVMPSPAKPTVLRRLPADFQIINSAVPSTRTAEQPIIGNSDTVLYARHEGRALSRALGSAVHKLLEELTRLRTTYDWDEARTELSKLQPRITAQARAVGGSKIEAESIATRAFDYALQTSRNPQGQWVLSPHAQAVSEAAWTGIVDGKLRSVRVDRLFRAGEEPLSQGENTWWLIDYKTAHADKLGPLDALLDLRRLFAPQLQAYSAVLHNLHGTDARIRAGLYYPRMTLFDWWEVN